MSIQKGKSGKKTLLIILLLLVIIAGAAVAVVMLQNDDERETETEQEWSNNENNEEEYEEMNNENSEVDFSMFSGENPIAVIEMEGGDRIVLELFPEIAPNTVNNFISLANSGFYDGVIFHRVIPDFMIQGGCPQGLGIGGPDYSILCETEGNDLAHTEGVLSMAHAGPNTGGSQFFIITGNAPHLNGVHTGFGKVLEGMDVVERIVNTRTGAQNRPVSEQTMRTVRVETFGVEFPAPETIERTR